MTTNNTYILDKLLLCPICNLPLTAEGRALRCDTGHSYDLSASGYVNLLRPGKMNNKRAGDNATMVRARANFLSGGYYTPIADYIVNTLSEILTHSGKEKENGIVARPFIIDAGSGTGWYSMKIASSLDEALVFGIDASKHAVDIASRTARRAGLSGSCAFAVASLSHMPIPDGCADAVLSLFAPLDTTEFARVIAPGGYLLVGSAGARHLFGLKKIIYDEPVENTPLKVDGGSDFNVICHENVSFSITVWGEDDILALFSMTPYFYRTPAEGAARLHQIKVLKTEVSVDFTLLRRV